MTEILKHTRKEEIPFVPFVKRTQRTPFYYLAKSRFGRWFTKDVEGITLYESDHKRKCDLQQLYQRECERNGRIYRAIFDKLSGDKKTTSKQYLDWLGSAYHSWLKSEHEEVTFMEYMQTIYVTKPTKVS